MIEAVGSMATGIGRAVSTAPSFGKEIGRGAAGGSFVSGLKTGNLFAETKPFTASVGAVPEMPISKSADIFSSAWSTLGKATAPSPSTTPKADSMRSLGFEPFVARPTVVAEKSISLNEGEWVTLAKAPARTIAEKVFPETKPLMPENPVFSKTVTKKDLTVFVESGYKATPAEEVVITKMLQAEKEQSKKVVDLMVEVGLYTREEAAKRVAKIAEKKGLVETEADAETNAGVRTEALAKPIPEANARKAKAINTKTQVATEEKKPEGQPVLKEKPPKKVPVVDEKVQEHRKNVVKQNISYLFNLARRFFDGTVNGKKIADGLEQKHENKSYLLTQIGNPVLPDGSLEQVTEEVQTYGEFADTSYFAEQQVREHTDEVLERNVPVKLARSASDRVGEKEVKKVLKYLQLESIAA